MLVCVTNKPAQNMQLYSAKTINIMEYKLALKPFHDILKILFASSPAIL